MGEDGMGGVEGAGGSTLICGRWAVCTLGLANCDLVIRPPPLLLVFSSFRGLDSVQKSTIFFFFIIVAGAPPPEY